MRSTRVVLVIICLFFGLIVPTAAVTIGKDEPTEGVFLEPSNGPNGQYATINDNKIQLDLESLNERAITTADNVFTITVNDEEVDRIWISNDVDGLKFYEGDDQLAEITESTPLEPSSGDTVHVGVAIDTQTIEDGTETFTVHVRYDEHDNELEDTPRKVELESVEVDPRTVETGESVTVNATYRNDALTTTEVTSALTVDDTVVETRTVEIDPREKVSVIYERQMQWPGAYAVGVDGATSDVTVEGPPIDVLEASVTTEEITAGDTGTIDATVVNPTNVTVERTLELAVDGIVVETRTVVLEPNGETTVTFERQFSKSGTYEIEVSGVHAGAITVSDGGPFLIQNRELSAATTAALAPPMTMGLLVLTIAANRRWTVVSL